MLEVIGNILAMALAQNVSRISEAEYLQLERQAETKSEFFNGEIFAMARCTSSHCLIAGNLTCEIGRPLKATQCLVYGSDLRLKVEATGLFTYPDLSVVCGRSRLLDDCHDTLLNPTVLIEVLSDSTEGYDRGTKSTHYRQIVSCREYLLVNQKEPRIEQFIHQPNGEWILKEAAGLNAELALSSLGIVLSLAEVFATVDFPPVPLRNKV